MISDESLPPVPRARRLYGYFTDVNRACQAWLEKRGLAMTAEERARATNREKLEYYQRQAVSGGMHQP